MDRARIAGHVSLLARTDIECKEILGYLPEGIASPLALTPPSQKEVNMPGSLAHLALSSRAEVIKDAFSAVKDLR
jgi:hypothetical protein